MTALITRAEYQTILNETLAEATYPTTYVEAILDSVSDELEGWCGRAFSAQTVSAEQVTAQVTTYNRQVVLKFQVKKVPVTAITKVEVWHAVDSSEPTELTSLETWFDADTGWVYVTFGLFGLWTTFFQLGRNYKARVTYTAGAGTVPTAIKRAAALLAQEVIALDSESAATGTDAVTSFSIGSYSESKAARDTAASDGLGMGTKNSILAAGLASQYRDTGALLV